MRTISRHNPHVQAPIPQPDADSPPSTERIAAVGIVINAALAIAKLITGLLGNSFALVADAVESIADILGSALVWGALRYARRPPDQDHPFGHGKAESLAALAVAAFIFFSGIAIAVEAIRGILSPTSPPAPFTLIVLIAVIIIKEVMFRITRRIARDAQSTIGDADAWHHRSDAITSLFALLGISLALLAGPAWAAADRWAALAASAVIIFNAIRLLRDPYAELMDQNDTVIADQCRDIALSIDAVRDVERSETRKCGRFHRVVMHVEVDPDMTVADSHRITGVIKSEIRAKIPSVEYVLIHIEPHLTTAPQYPASYHDE